MDERERHRAEMALRYGTPEHPIEERESRAREDDAPVVPIILGPALPRIRPCCGGPVER